MQASQDRGAAVGSSRLMCNLAVTFVSRPRFGGRLRKQQRDVTLCSRELRVFKRGRLWREVEVVGFRPFTNQEAAPHSGVEVQWRRRGNTLLPWLRTGTFVWSASQRQVQELDRYLSACLDLAGLEAVALAEDSLAVGQTIGSGSVGIVSRGHLHGTGTVAVKEPIFDSPALLVDIVNEAAILARLRHPCLLRFYGVCSRVSPVLGNTIMIVTELCGNGSLKGAMPGSREALRVVWWGTSTVAGGLQGCACVSIDPHVPCVPTPPPTPRVQLLRSCAVPRHIHHPMPIRRSDLYSQRCCICWTTEGTPLGRARSLSPWRCLWASRVRLHVGCNTCTRAASCTVTSSQAISS